MPLLTLQYRAYKTLVNESSRKEYDEYMESYMSLSHVYHTKKEEPDDEETERRKKGKISQG